MLTEEMIDAPRGFLMGMQIGCSTLESMRAHLDRCGFDYSCWPDWAKTETGHITKTGKAILIYTMMEARKPLTTDKDARISELERECVNAKNYVVGLSETVTTLANEKLELERMLVEQQTMVVSLQNRFVFTTREELTTLLAKAKEEGRREAVPEDTARLDWLIRKEAWIGWTREGDHCRVFHQEDNESTPMTGWPVFFDTAREAIDAAMLAAAPKPEGANK